MVAAREVIMIMGCGVLEVDCQGPVEGFRSGTVATPTTKIASSTAAAVGMKMSSSNIILDADKYSQRECMLSATEQASLPQGNIILANAAEMA